MSTVSIQWMWENDAGSGYNNFDEHLSNLLERMYNCPELKRKPFTLPYKNFVWEFDFAKMTQNNKESASSRKIIRVQGGTVWIWYIKNQKQNFNVIDSEYASTLNSMNALGPSSTGPGVFRYDKNGDTFQCTITGGRNKYECTNDIVIEKVSVDEMQTLKVAPASSPQPQPQSSLPPGWESQVDPSSGRVFYVSPTGRSQWNPPPPFNVIPPPPPLQPTLPSGWVQLVDPASNKVYYHNASTGVSQWKRPDGGGGGAGIGKMKKKKRFVKQHKTYKKKRHIKRKTNKYKQ